VQIDEEDKYLLKEHGWTITAKGYVELKTRELRGKLLHRVILAVQDSKVHVDHINGDPLDNRKCNLRLCSTQENQFNSGPKNKNGLPKGVAKVGDRYRARLKINYTQYHLGYFNTIEAADAAYKAAAKKYFKEFDYYAR
jgi:hypothetical protein